ncbi:hypothetical protein [Kitasatospora sp. NPDC004272]
MNQDQSHLIRASGPVLAELTSRHPGQVVHLRREHGGQGKAHTLNHHWSTRAPSAAAGARH